MSAIAAVDTALWDIKGKVAGLPLYEICWAARAATASWSTDTPTATTSPRPLDEVARYIEMGYKAIRAQCGIPGLPSTYGVARDKLFYEPRRCGDPDRNASGPRASISTTSRSCSTRCARVSGFEHHLLHDVHHRLTPIEAGRLGRALEPYRLFWMEDPTPAENQQAFRLIRQHTVTPIAVGEVFNTIYDCQTLIGEQLIDYIRTTVVHAGGITPSAPHRPSCRIATRCAPARTARRTCRRSAWARRCTSIPGCPNFGIQEYMRHTPETDAVFPHAYYVRGRLSASRSTPGHGVDIDETLAARYPYRPSALPVNRLEDGAMWNW